MKIETIQRRVRAIRSGLRSRNIDGLILTRPANVTYATAFSGDDSWAIVTKRTVYLLTDSRYTEQARKECPQATIVSRTEPIAPAAGKLLAKLKSAKTVAIEKSTSLAFYEALRKSLRRPVKTVDGVLEDLRSVKDPSELAAIKKAAAIATDALAATLGHLKPGISESELAGLLDLQIRRFGSTNSFETIVAFGANASRPHHQPTRRTLRARDTVLIDFGAKYEGYCSDITRCFVLGKPTAAYRRAYEVVERAQTAAIKAARAGADLRAIDAAPRQVIANSGLPVYGHGSGHGIGLEIHEAPMLSERAEGKLRAGQIITIEPGIYIPGKLGIRIEDDILITGNGCEILTRKCPHTPLPA